VRARPYLARGACAELLDCDDPEIVIVGPAETGKTMAALHRLNRLAWQWPGMQGAIIRRTHRSMAGTVLQTFKDKVLAKGSPVRVLGGTNPDRYIYPNGSQLWVGGMDQPEKVLSAERDVIYVNQAEELPLDHWEFLSTRVTGRAGNVPNPQLIGDCNPAAPTHWIRQRSLAGNMRMIESTHKDNPTLYDARGKLTEQGKRTLARLDRLTGTRKMRFRFGIWAQPEGAIYEAFDEVRHKVPSKPIPALWPRVVGIDPFGARIGAVFLAFDPGQGILNVYDEYLEPFGITTPGHVAGLLKQAKGQTIFAWVGGGPSERQARVDWAGAGIPLLEVPISDVWAGIDRVNQLLADFRLVVHDNCTHLLAEIGSYQRKLKDGVPTEAIQDKEQFHCLTGDTVVAVEGGGKELRDIRPGDKVLTRLGYRRVLTSACTNPSAKVLLVRLSNGQTLRGTPDHLVWVKGQGYTALQSLQYCDTMMTSHEAEALQWHQKRAGAKRQEHTARIGEGILTPNESQIGTSGLGSLCMSMSGRCITAGLFLMDTWFTILMAIRRITTLRTSLLCRLRSTCACMFRSAMTLTGCGNSRRLAGSMRRHGTAPRKGGDSTLRSASSLGRGLTKSAKPVKVAGGNIPPGTWPSVGLDSAPTNASRHGGDGRGSITNKGLVLTAEHLSRSTSTPAQPTAPVYVLTVIALHQREAVYNLEVEEPHEFFANGILVHNCLDALRYVVAWLTEPGERTEVVYRPVQIGPNY